MKKIFITGTDTDIGKTFVSVGLCLKLEALNYKVGYFKPLQSGAYKKNGAIAAPDLEELKKYSNIPSKYSYLFEGEISPHLAALINNIEVDINKIKDDFTIFSSKFDFTIVEGAGGIYCPAYKHAKFSDIIKALDIETIVVTTPKLGRLNHLLMTLECAKINNIKVKGVIINSMAQKTTLSEQNFIKELREFSDVDILGVIPRLNNPDKKEILETFKNVNLE